MKINKDDIDFKRINKVIDELDDSNYSTVLMLCAILIKAVADQDKSTYYEQCKKCQKNNFGDCKKINSSPIFYVKE